MRQEVISTRNPNLELRSHTHPPEPSDPHVGPRSIDWWAGPGPARCPGIDGAGVLRSLRTPDLARSTRQEVLDYFDNTWCLTEVLFSALQGQRAFDAPPWHRLRHPMIFYYCHPAALYVNKLRLAGLCAAIDPFFEALFENGVDEMSWDDLSQSELDWPAVGAVTDYRRRVYREVHALIETHRALEPGHPPITNADPLWALFMAMEHERIHLELSSVLVRELPIEWLMRPREWPPLHPSAASGPPVTHPVVGRDFPENAFVDVSGGVVRIGKLRDQPVYGWDNEYGGRTVDLAPFRVQRHLVSNGEYLDFVLAEGYLDRSLWSAEGWGWRQFRNAKWPPFWVSAGPSGLHEYRLRTLFEIVEMPWSWPAEVNFHEAQAYRRWRELRDGRCYRLLSEAKHHRLRSAPANAPDGLDDQVRNAGLAHGSPGPVDAFAPAGGVHDVFGNVWQWCEDDFHPLAGFRVDPLYDDFSTPCFDGKHQLVLGGSFVSTGAAADAWARFHFRPHFHQHAGLRLVETDERAPDDAVRLGADARAPDVYEREDALREYMLLHWGSSEDAMPFRFGPTDAIGFPERCAQWVVELAGSFALSTGRALDVGCAVGRATFELGRWFDEVLGIDRSESFIRAATTLKGDGRLPYFRRDQGELGENLVAAVDPAIDRSRVRFRVGDACALPAELLGFDAVLAANLLCRLPSPRAFLERLGGPRGIVRPGGLLVVTSPYTWSEAFTPKEVWLGGVRRDGMAIDSFEGLRTALGPEFELVAERDMPLVIREHRRKYQYIVAHATAWRRGP